MEYYRSLDASTLDPDFPTFFELLASRQLGDFINPYLRYIIEHYAQRHPRYLLRIMFRFDELYLLGFGLVEYLYLNHWNSSFVEKFYGLKRTNRLPVLAPRTRKTAGAKIDPLRRLTRTQVWGSVAFLVLVPYLREKVLAKFEQLQARYKLRDLNEDRPGDNAPLVDHWRFQANIFLLKWFPRAEFAANTIQLLLIARYLFHGSGPFTLSDYVLNTRYSRLTQWDKDAREASMEHGRLKPLKQVLGTLGYILPATLFGIKFLEWWNSSEYSSKLARSGPELPPPNCNTKPEWSCCPICQRADPQKPAVLETGVVYCYKCIDTYLRSMDPKSIPMCPATSIELLLTQWNAEIGRWDIGGLRRLHLT